MREFTRIAITLALAGCIAPAAQACDKGRDGGERRAKVIEKFDKDGDGKLSEDERAAAREALKEMAGKRREELIKKFDKDGDGKLSEEERKAAKEAMKKKCGGRKNGNNGVGNGEDPQPPGNPPVNDGPGTGPGNPGQREL